MTAQHPIFRQKQIGSTTGEAVLALAFTAAVAFGVYKVANDPIVADMVAEAAPTEDKAFNTLDAQGMKNIVMEGKTYVGCATDDTVGYKFTATNGNNRTVRGIVCMDWNKGSTIRYR